MDELNCKLVLVFHCTYSEERENERERDRKRKREREKQRQKQRERKGKKKKASKEIRNDEEVEHTSFLLLIE